MKARTNVSIEAALLDEARGLGVNLSSVLEAGLRTELAARRRARWLEENRGALSDANAFLQREGLWSDGKRQF